MWRRIAAGFLGLTLCAGPRAGGDIVPAADGRRYRGLVVAADVRWAVILTNPLPDPANPFAGWRIVRRSDEPIVFEPLALPPGRPASQPAQSEAAAAIQVLREAVLILRDDHPEDALLALQRLVTTASPAALRAAEAWCREHLHRDLAHWLARLRLEVALDPEAPRALKLTGVTRYEREALTGLLHALLEQRLAARHAGRSVEAWADEPDAELTLTPDAPALVRDARIAAAAIGALLRWDAGLRRDRARRQGLVELRRRLMRLVARIEALPGYTQQVARWRGVVPDGRTATMPAGTRPAGPAW